MDSDTVALVFAVVGATGMLVAAKLWSGRGGRKSMSWPLVVYVVVVGNALFFALWLFALRDQSG